MIEKIFNFQFSILNLRFSGKDIVKHPLFSGSAVMIVGSNVANFLAYIYHLVMGRLLGPSGYSALATVISIMGILSVVTASFNLAIVKFVSSAGKKEQILILGWLKRKAFIFGFLILLGFSLFVPFLSQFTRIGSGTLFLIGPIFLVGVLSFIYKSLLQGLMRFGRFVAASNIEAALKLVLGVLFVVLGYSVFGATLGMLLAFLVGWFVAIRFLSDLKVERKGKFTRGKEFLVFTIPIVVYTISLTSLYSTDVVLVKHFFSAHDAGIYASLSTLGRVIFFAAAPVSSVMFPMVSRRHSKRQGYRKIFLYSLGLTSLIASAILFFYLFFPEFAIRMLFGAAYLSAAPLLFWFGIFMALFTLSSFIISFFLSIGKTKIVALTVFAALGQAIGIWFWHESIFTVIKISIFSVSFLILALLIYFGHESIKAKEKA